MVIASGEEPHFKLSVLFVNQHLHLEIISSTGPLLQVIVTTFRAQNSKLDSIFP